MRRPHPCESPGLRLHHCLEVVAAVGALLLQVEADGGEVFVMEGSGQQVPVGLAPFRVGRAQCALGGVQRQ